MRMKRIFLLGFAFIYCFSYAQVELRKIQIDSITQPKVRDFILKQSKDSILYPNDLNPSCKSHQDMSGFHKQVRSYVINDSISKVWNTYLTTSPARSWDGRKIKFGALLSKKNNSLLYSGTENAEIDTGQVIFLNLKLLKGLYNLALAFEIITIDNVNHTIEFSYINGNVSKGLQRVHFVQTTRGNTRIIHTSYFKSSSRMRDWFIYPFFHEKATDEFHRNMLRLV